MRVIAFVASLVATSLIAIVAIGSRSTDTQSQSHLNTYFTDVISTRDENLLEEFIASLDKEKMAEIIDQRGDLDLDDLASCGDFDLYARYMRVSKFEAVKKFRYLLLYTDSRLEFRHRLAR